MHEMHSDVVDLSEHAHLDSGVIPRENNKTKINESAREETEERKY